jgi:Fe-S-cluster containining protein
MSGADSPVFTALSATTSVATRLCGACGLCCNGVMFHTVRLQPNDAPPKLAALGLKLKRRKRQDLLLQPCPAYQDGRCSIYTQRPERCRLFECKQLQRVKTGEITEAMALEKIREVQRLAAQLDALSRRADGTQRKGPLSRRCETALAEPFDATTHPELVGQREEIARGLSEMEAVLDEHFRVPADDLNSG